MDLTQIALLDQHAHNLLTPEAAGQPTYGAGALQVLEVEAGV